MTEDRSGWTYDMKREVPAPCGCKLLVTNPHLCVREGRCLLAGHPHEHRIPRLPTEPSA